MVQKWDMSDLLEYERIPLGEEEKNFIKLFSLEPITAYDITSHFEAIRSTLNERPMSYKNIRKRYKNVHKRVKRLQELKLIEEIRGKYPRKAKPYKLTSRGLFQYFLLHAAVSLSTPVLTAYHEDIILQNLLYQYFEVDTIMNFSDSGLQFLSSYLQKCCEDILTSSNVYRGAISTINFLKESIKLYHMSSIDVKRYSIAVKKEEEMLENIPVEVNRSLKNEIKNFVFEIVTLSAYDYLNTNMDRINQYGSTFPVPVLIKDKKFMKVFNDVKEGFDEGCKLFV